LTLNLSVVGLWEKAKNPINIGFCNSRESDIQDQPLIPLQISPRNAVIAVVSGFFEVDFAENFNNFNFRLGIEQKKGPKKWSLVKIYLPWQTLVSYARALRYEGKKIN
jgi:hypothetical protein|tara:strand:- start:2 stop:325 length:324 start_codon:yes stop_codon:yes gene_type:complete